MRRAGKLSVAFAVAMGIWFTLPALAAAASLAPTTLAFGDVPLGTTKTLTAAVTLDPGYSLASFSSADGAFSPPWQLDTSGCSANSDAACSIGETFTASTLGAKTAHLDAFECPLAGGTCIKIGTETLSATGVSVGALAPTTLAFGDVPLGTTKTLSAAVKLDHGYSLASLSSADGAFSPPWQLDTSACAANSDAACSIGETFTASTLGAKTAHFDAFECPLAGGTCIKIATETLTATGVSVGALAPTTLAFGDVPLGTTKTLSAAVTLDHGYSLASLSSADGAFSPPWQLDTSGCAANSDAACSIGETFTASTLGAKTAHFDAFECPLAGGTCIKIGTETLTATGVSVGALAPTTLAFGDVPLGTTKTLSAAVTLDHGYSLASLS